MSQCDVGYQIYPFYARVRIRKPSGYRIVDFDFYKNMKDGDPLEEPICIKEENKEYRFFVPRLYRRVGGPTLEFDDLQNCVLRMHNFRLIVEGAVSIDPETLEIHLRDVDGEEKIFKRNSQEHALFLLTLTDGCLLHCEECRKIMEKFQRNTV